MISTPQVKSSVWWDPKIYVELAVPQKCGHANVRAPATNSHEGKISLLFSRRLYEDELKQNKLRAFML